jgi:hypothetical protein
MTATNTSNSGKNGAHCGIYVTYFKEKEKRMFFFKIIFLVKIYRERLAAHIAANVLMHKKH